MKPGIVVLKDQILVSDSWLHSVFMFDFDGVMKSRFGVCGTGHGKLMTPIHKHTFARKERAICIADACSEGGGGVCVHARVDVR